MSSRLHRAIALGSISFATSACMAQPKDPSEFRAAVREGGFMTRVEEQAVGRDFDSAFTAVRRSAERCLNTRETSSTPGKYGPQTESVDYHASSRALGPRAGELAVQMNSANMIGDYPEGGVYILVADLEQSQTGASKLTVYAAGKGGDMVEAIVDWAQGKSEDCPEL
jgi:hypothetical protein